MTRKILYITSTASKWGSEESLFLLVKNLPIERYVPYVMTTPGPFQKKLENSNIANEIFTSYTLNKINIIKFTFLVLRLAFFIKTGGFSLVHSNDVHSSQYTILAARIAGVPSIAHVRSPGLADWLKPLNVNIIKSSSKVVAISTSVRDELQTHGLSKKKIVLIHNAVDISNFHKLIVRCDNKSEKIKRTKELTVGVIGRITPQKGHEFFIRSIPEILCSWPSARFVIVGDAYPTESDYIQKLKQEVMRLELVNHVFFEGYKTEIPKIMNSLDVLVVPSLMEPFGRVAIEAMAAKTPVVASAVGGLTDIIRDGYNGLLVPPTNSNAIAGAVIRLLTDNQLYASIIKNGRSVIEKKYTVQIQIKKIEKLYDNLINPT